MNKKTLLFTFTLLLVLSFSKDFFGQIAINNTGADPDPSAILDIQSTDKGVLIPKVDISDLATASPVSNPATGLLVWNTNSSTGTGFYFWNGTAWEILGDGDRQNLQQVLAQGTDGGNQAIVNINQMGIGTSSPNAAADLEVQSSSNPAVYLTQNSPLFGNYTWGLQSDHEYFSIADISGGTLPFRIKANTPTNTLVLRPNGNVGLGILNPSYKLQVNGDSYITGNVGIGMAPTRALDVVGDAYVSSKLGIGIAPTNALDVVGNATLTGALTADSLSANQVQITRLYDKNNSLGQNNYVLTSGVNGLEWIDPATVNGDNLGNHTATQNINLGNFWLSSNGGNNGIHIDNGRVSVNTSEHINNTQLIVSSGNDAMVSGQNTVNVANLQTVIENSSGTGGVGIGFKSSSTANQPTIGAAIVHETTGANSKGKLHFAAKTTTGTYDNLPIQMTLDDEGQFGIGTTAPGQALDVVGNGNFSGSVIATSIGAGVTPAGSIELHVGTGDSPTLRMEQLNGPWGPYTWDIGGNEFNLFVRDVVTGNLPLRIRPGAPYNSILIDPQGDIGLGVGGSGVHTVAYKLQVGLSGDGTEARANAWNLFSDKRWKRDFEVIPNALKKVMALNGYYYYWKDKKDKSRQVGLIAQEVQEVLPEIVSTDAEGYHSVDYSKVSPLLIEALKELEKEQNELLETQTSLKADMEWIKSELETLKKSADEK